MSTLDQLYTVLSATLEQLKNPKHEPDYKRIQAINETAGAMTAVARLEIDFRRLKLKHGGTFFPALPEEPAASNEEKPEATKRLTKHGSETAVPVPGGVIRQHRLS